MMSSTLQDPNQSDQPNPPPPPSSASSPSRPEKLYQATLKTVPPAMSALLAEYSGIPPHEQKTYITSVRDRAYATHPYPCLGRWRFLELDLANHPLYRSEILPSLSSSEPSQTRSATDGLSTAAGPTTIDFPSNFIFLDLGCCLGQDLRKLIHDGADATRLMGADLNPEFIEIGYSLFRDRDRFPWEDHFIAPADVFDFSPSSELSQRCDGKVGILHCTAVFHLFGLDEQKMVARRCLRLVLGDGNNGNASRSSGSRTEKGGTTRKALICGGQAGHIRAGEYAREPNKKSRYRHNEQSWRQMWEELAAEDDSVWKDRTVKVDVHAVMEERTFGDDNGQSGSQNQSSGGAGGDEGRPSATTNSVANNTQRQIGSVEEGFRWMKWWVWLEFR